MVLEISPNSPENTCARVSFLIKFQVWFLQLYYKKTLAQVFSCEFCEIGRKPFLQNTSGRLLLLQSTENCRKSDVSKNSNVVYDFLQNELHKGNFLLVKVNFKIFNPNLFQKWFFLLVMLKWRFQIKFLRNVTQKLSKECNCRLTPLFLGRNKEVIILYPYFICKHIEPFLCKHFTL